MMLRAWAGIAGAFALLLSYPSAAKAEDFADGSYAFSVQTDVTYGQGLVGASGGDPRARDLKLDVYQPLADGKPLADRPAVILAFGGAFLRGSKGTARFEENGASDSAMGEYCRTFAAEGYVCLSIEYRLMVEAPAMPAGLDPATLLPKAMAWDPATTARVDVVRGRMGLPPLDDATREHLWSTIFAASEDLASAVSFARANSDELGIDPERIAVGGFSAGAITAINAAYGMGVPVKAMFSLSGSTIGFDLRQTARAGMPPGLFIVGQNDLEGMIIGTRAVAGTLSAAGIQSESAWIPGFGHFYPMGAVSLGDDLSKHTLKARLLEFLGRHLTAADE
ncbi:hypothetical protein P7228_14980 [Altererythrobacter arenosus]|uniref:Phospholipase/carboxylesterase/thioesterase domain-containing protein n=1 Tax=Altererythrobacter arenosus TaxID=3032592 RepID=A0ABY8FQI5_9SPHN|nr:hypothetical protein [Altererythrobacter sp. CAU 1644]WFL77273.1 hypothetical protein P7228_14980 [Altererythrobacter sp. CAU 1644]